MHRRRLEEDRANAAAGAGLVVGDEVVGRQVVVDEARSGESKDERRESSAHINKAIAYLPASTDGGQLVAEEPFKAALKARNGTNQTRIAKTSQVFPA